MSSFKDYHRWASGIYVIKFNDHDHKGCTTANRNPYLTVALNPKEYQIRKLKACCEAGGQQLINFNEHLPCGSSVVFICKDSQKFINRDSARVRETMHNYLAELSRSKGFHQQYPDELVAYCFSILIAGSEEPQARMIKDIATYLIPVFSDCKKLKKVIFSQQSELLIRKHSNRSYRRDIHLLPCKDFLEAER
ncbi:UNVERIFIED_CONTAM: hypothetical protein Sradi_2936400 [Sesamum radiatum]|uniref:Uncharacterized protein n=1 Tax=Sesamum radiatum TaxID=300843 RepID=A0AAW2S0Z4_SESRA